MARVEGGEGVIFRRFEPIESVNELIKDGILLTQEITYYPEDIFFSNNCSEEQRNFFNENILFFKKKALDELVAQAQELKMY